MASIQQSMNQLLGAVAGAGTMGAYMIRGSNWYKAGQADKSAETIEKTLNVSEEDLAKMTPAQREAHLKRQELATEKRAEAGTLYPTRKRAEGISASYQQLEEKKGMIDKVKGAEAEKAENEAREAFEAEERAQLEEDLRTGVAVLNEDGSISYPEYSFPEPKAKAPANDWQGNLSRNMNQPGDRSADRMKMAKMTRDLKYAERQKAERTVRNVIMNQEALSAKQKQTEEYQNVLRLYQKEG